MDARKLCFIGLALRAFLFISCENDKNPASVIKPVEGQIVFVSKLSTSVQVPFEIYLINDNGTGLRKLADGLESNIAPDDNKMLFTGSGGARLDIFMVRIEGGAPQNLTQTPVGDSEGQGSPDGSMIAYQSGPNCSTDNVWIMNADGSGQRQVTSDTTAFNHSPHWSPDGKRIAFVWSLKNAEGKYSGYDEIHVINMDGTGERKIVVAGNLLNLGPTVRRCALRKMRKSISSILI